MGKASLSVTVDSEILGLLEGRDNKSYTINQILKRALKTEEGIQAEIEHHNNQIKLLETELQQLKVREKEKIENISDALKRKLKVVKDILETRPEKVYIWTEIINRNYNQNITPDSLRKLIERWV